MLILHSDYQAPRGFGNGHLQTIYANMIRRVMPARYVRERIKTPDKDFLDLDWSRVGAGRLVIISHGLEGSSNELHIRGMVHAFNQNGWDALAWNYRGCSGTPNRQLRSYHSGVTDDLETVIMHALKNYGQIALVGFSLGGNLTLKYLGERGNTIDKRIKGAAVFSVPVSLAATSHHLAKLSNGIYMVRFLFSLYQKVRAKKRIFPGQISDRGFWKMRTFQEFDDRYTAPLHGFKNAEDYWEQCSAEKFLSGIRLPTLLVNALDDPFLPERCFPYGATSAHTFLHLETPTSGGHVGFVSFNRQNRYWSEQRAVEFLSSPIPG